MSCKATLHIQRILAWMPGILAELGSAWVKIVDPQPGPDPFPGLKKVLRIWTDDWDRPLIARGRAGAEDYMAQMMPRWRQFLNWGEVVFELPNEPECNSDEGLWALNAFTMRCIEIAGEKGFVLAILNLPEGNPGANPGEEGEQARATERWKMQQLATCCQAAIENGHYISMHGYWCTGAKGGGPTEVWQALRYKVNLQYLAGAGVPVDRARILLTEVGEDGGIVGRQHKSFPTMSSRQAHIANAIAFDSAVRQDPRVEAYFLFDVGPHDPWQDFEHDEALLRELASRLPEAPVEPPPPPPVPEPPEPELPDLPATVSADGVTYEVADVPGVYWSERDWGEVMVDGAPRLWIIIHDTEGPRQSAFAWWQDPDNPYKSSAHDLVDAEGVVWRCVTYDRAAHHCGGSHLPGYSGPDPNDVTIGIELEYPATPASPPWPQEQLQAAVRHVGELCRSFGIPRERVLRHSDIDPANRCDPRNLPLESFLDRVFPRSGGLPEDEPATEPALMAEKARWWLEEEQRQREGGNLGRADEIRLSLIRLMYRLESALKVA